MAIYGQMSYSSQLLSTSQINCHKGSAENSGHQQHKRKRVFVSHCPGHLLLVLLMGF